MYRGTEHQSLLVVPYRRCIQPVPWYPMACTATPVHVQQAQDFLKVIRREDTVCCPLLSTQSSQNQQLEHLAKT